jgi:hypothetical protein
MSDDALLGVHYWSHSTSPCVCGEVGYKTHKAPDDIPEVLRKYRYKHSITENQILTDDVFPVRAAPLYYKIISTRIAFKNALDTYQDMPDDQPIIWTRPDVIVGNINSFPKTVKKNEFISIWNTIYRPNPEEPEVGDVLALTTKYVIQKLLNLELSYICDICSNEKFSEQFLYKILKHLDVEITFDHSLKLGLMRETHIHKLTC